MTSRAQTLDFDWRLQSLRGLAALAVALGHSFTVLPHGQPAIFGANFTLDRVPAALFSLVFQANSAVIFFYVLSGYVLFLSLRRSGQSLSLRNSAAFVAKRAGRLYPVVWIAVAFWQPFTSARIIIANSCRRLAGTITACRLT